MYLLLVTVENFPVFFILRHHRTLNFARRITQIVFHMKCSQI